jgi:hypothetical protein
MARVLLLTLLSVLLSGGLAAHAQPIVWDNFTPPEKKLDPVKWFKGDQLTGNGALGLEIRREITGAKLVMGHRAVGTSDIGRGFSLNRLFLFPPTPLTSFQADLKITGFNTTQCTEVPIDSVISFEQVNRLFNTSSMAGNGDDFAGDGGACASPGSCNVYAKFFIEHSPSFNGPDVFDIRGRVWAEPLDEFGNPSGPEIVVKDAPIGALAGTLKKNQKVTVKWVWDADAHTVTFSTSHKGVVPLVVDYGTVGPTNPMPFLFNDLEVDVFPCNSTVAPGVAELNMAIDKILVTLQ